MKTATPNVLKILMLTAILLAAPAGVSAQEAGGGSGDMAQPAEANAPAMTASVTSVDGTAFYRENEQAQWKPAEAGVTLAAGGQIKTGLRGRVEMALGPNADIAVDRLTLMTIGRLEQDGQTIRTLLGVARGKVDFHVKHVGFANDFKIASPTGTMAVKGTDGTFICDELSQLKLNNGNAGFDDHNTGRNYNTIGGQNSGDGGNDSRKPETNNRENTNFDGENTNLGDGNGNGSGGDTPNLDAFDGNNSRRDTMRQFFQDSIEAAPDGGDQ